MKSTSLFNLWINVSTDLRRSFNLSRLRFLSHAKALRDRGRFWPNRPLRCRHRARVQFAPCSFSTRCSKAYRISWQQLTAACYFPQAIREAANPVLWVRDANLRCELIAQAGGAWQEKWWPSRSNSLLFLSVPERTQSRESRRTETDY